MKDYTKFSKEIQNGFAEEPVVEKVAIKEPEVEETVIEEIENDPKHGVVVDCVKLNVRSEPSRESEVVCVINVSTDLIIDEEASTEDFYKVCTASGAEGYCMKKFIEILP